MPQTKTGSVTEAVANVAVGFWINFMANLVVLPLFGFASLSLGKNFLIGVIYTGISLIRSYVLRRWFNGLKFGHTRSKANDD